MAKLAYSYTLVKKGQNIFRKNLTAVFLSGDHKEPGKISAFYCMKWQSYHFHAQWSKGGENIFRKNMTTVFFIWRPQGILGKNFSILLHKMAKLAFSCTVVKKGKNIFRKK